MSNKLAKESSPYLLQHAENPVDWWPWCDEAFEAARSKDIPVFLSIGYSACHWCHVMEHESFEDVGIAKFLNKNFVSIKVDREERPDIDHIYMQSVMAISGQGGWPLSAFLSPDQLFFFGGTYWPPKSSRGMPGFDQVIRSVSDTYKEKRETIEEQSKQVFDLLKKNSQPTKLESSALEELLSRKTIGKAVDQLQGAFDVNEGGFGSSPKFPHPMDLNLLIRTLDYADQLGDQSKASVLQMIEITLNKMAYGGINDHLGGGFARYSVDEKWLVPHFEKMLYDNAQLASVYVNAFKATGNEFFRRTAEKTLDYVLEYLGDKRGGFHSTEDADSEGVEGKFYVWDKAEIIQILGEETGELFCGLYDVSEAGNFEGSNILNVPEPYGDYSEKHNLDKSELRAQMKDARQKLIKVRNQRVRPSKDDKILVSWNALAIDAFASAAIAFDSTKYLAAAQDAASFLLNTLRRDDGRLQHTWRDGEAKLDAYLDDYAYLINALVSLYEADFDERWIDAAVELAKDMIEHFGSTDGGFLFTADDHESLIVRTRDLQDSSVPSGNSMAAHSLLRLGRLCGNSTWVELAEATIVTAGALIERAPMATGQMLLALDLFLRPNQQFVIVGGSKEEKRELLAMIREAMEPGATLLYRSEENPSATSQDLESTSENLETVFSGKASINQQPTLYICENFTCQSPVIGTTSIKKIFGVETIDNTQNLGEVV